jgi:hypothetical protein
MCVYTFRELISLACLRARPDFEKEEEEVVVATVVRGMAELAVYNVLEVKEVEGSAREGKLICLSLSLSLEGTNASLSLSLSCVKLAEYNALEVKEVEGNALDGNVLEGTTQSEQLKPLIPPLALAPAGTSADAARHLCSTIALCVEEGAHVLKTPDVVAIESR